MTVLEAADEVSEIGAGIQVTPNFTRILYRWGLAERLASVGVQPQWTYHRRWKDGTTLTAFRLNADKRMENLFGVPYYHVHRPDLIQMLHDRALELGVVVKSHCSVIGYTHDAATSLEQVQTQNGELYTADLLVAADGIRSIFNGIVLGSPVPSVPTGDSAYRGLLTAEQMSDRAFADLDVRPNSTSWFGPNSHVVMYFVRSAELYNVVIIVPDEEGEESWKVKGDMEKLRKRFHDWDPRLRRLLDLIPESYVWKLRDRPALDRWLHKEGNVVLLGDAAHPTLPYIAQGAASACEDAAVLVECLEYAKAKGPGLRPALEVYQRLRIPRAHKMREMARHNQAYFHLPDGEYSTEAVPTSTTHFRSTISSALLIDC